MIYIATHKLFEVPRINGYIPLQVGAYKSNIEGYLHDDTCDNISVKNPNYCELTGLYWIWKNTADDFKGMVHYRRYFTQSLLGDKILRIDEIKELLKEYEMIVPYSIKHKGKTVRQQYSNSGFEKDIDTVEKVLLEMYPQYEKAFFDVMNGDRTYFYNMLVARKEVFDNYCKWLFSVLFQVEQRVDLTGYTDYQKRIFGFLSERLLTVYVIHNDIKVIEMGVDGKAYNQDVVHKVYRGLKRKIMYFTRN